MALLRLADIEDAEGLLFEADREFRRFLDFFPGHPEQGRVYLRLQEIKGELLEYRDRTTPRQQVSSGIYTATDHPLERNINLQNEGTYWLAWPLKLHFCYLKVPHKGGETPIGDV